MRRRAPGGLLRGSEERMPIDRRVPRGCIAFALLAAAAGSAVARGAEVLPAGRYEVVVEIGMPHLEETLRYATTREERCLVGQPLAGAFPILAHPALAGCVLDGERREGHEVLYDLACSGSAGTTGGATWRVDDGVSRGTLAVRL